MNPNLRNLTNHFLDVRLVSLASWRRAAEITPRDRNGPYVVLQEGYDPNDMRFVADEFILGRSGKWLRLGFFYQLPVRERRAEFVFGTVGEVMKLTADLPSGVRIYGRSQIEPGGAIEAEQDEMTEAIETGRHQPSHP
jgi:hypothetical protein